MESLYRTFDRKIPWGFRTPRDTRTLFALVPDEPMVKNPLKHSAERDAIAQAQTVQNVYARLFAADRGI